jgi:glycosyltransferase involved in cell wall biosynthesis
MRLCLNSIVKNESARILRMLESVAPHISCYVIADTGSTDGTPDMIKKFFEAAHIPGELVHCKFEDFSQARNVALFAAQKSNLAWDYAMLCDADMEFKVYDEKWIEFLKDAPAYDMYQVAGTLHYQNRRFVKRGEHNGYRGVTHEYLDVATGGCVPQEKAFFLDYADGANRPDKFKRDIRLLKKGLEDEPTNERYMYYLAQSYRDAGKADKAVKWYQRRIAAGGWDEEVWSAMYCLAHALKDLGDEAGFIRKMLDAYNYRPSRAEPLYDLAHWYRERGENATGLLFAETGIQIPTSKDALFVNDFVYTAGCLEEYAIMAFYVPHKRTAGYKVNNMLSLKRMAYTGSRELARVNMYHYFVPLKDLCKSFTWKPLAFIPPKDYVAMNPSIAANPTTGQLHVVVRNVNYRIDDQGRYLIRATDGTSNGTNPIHTRNFLAILDENLEIVPDSISEIRPPVDLPKPLFDLVIGFEDCRLYTVDGAFWVSATMRELTPEGYCEIVRARINHLPPVQVFDEMTRMKRRGHEKNWMPVADGQHHFMYRCDELVDGTGESLIKHDAVIDVGALAGGSQLIPMADGWLAVVHEATLIPGQQTRFYSHRFVAFDKSFVLKKVTAPFYLHEKGIEYVSGLALSSDKTKLILSYGFKDCEARIATVDVKELETFLWAS